MNLELKDKVAIVGGASMGIGYGIARVLAQEGAMIAITARREPALSDAAERLRKETGARVIPIAADARIASLVLQTPDFASLLSDPRFRSLLPAPYQAFLATAAEVDKIDDAKVKLTPLLDGGVMVSIPIPKRGEDPTLH